MLLLLLASLNSHGDAGPRTESVVFENAATSTTITSEITGYETIDYVLASTAGQPVSITLNTAHSATYFNILAPHDTDAAIFNGSISGNRYASNLAITGDYTIRIYMMRSAARRNETANYQLLIDRSIPAHTP